MSKVVDILTRSYDLDTRLCERSFINLLGDLHSPYLNAVKNKCIKLGISYVHPPQTTNPFGAPFIVDVETYRGVCPVRFDPEDDIDCVFTQGTSCVAQACYDILNSYHSIEGMNVVIVGRGHSVKGLSSLLLNDDATVTVCHSHTRNLSKHTKVADAIIYTAPCWDNLPYTKDCIVIDVSGVIPKSPEVVSDVGRLTTSITCNRIARRRN